MTNWKYPNKTYGRRYSLGEWLGCFWHREPHITIPDDAPYYLFRWHVIPTFMWTPVNGYIHKFLRDDSDRALHDHPRPSLSICLSEGFTEIYQTGPNAEIKTRQVKPGSIIYRGLKFRHRVLLNKDAEGKPIPAMTLFMVGPKMREWGFWCDERFVHYKKFEETMNCD